MTRCGTPVGVRPVGVRPVGVRPVGVRPFGVRPARGRTDGMRPFGVRPVGVRPGRCPPRRRSSVRRAPRRRPACGRARRRLPRSRGVERRDRRVRVRSARPSSDSARPGLRRTRCRVPVVDATQAGFSVRRGAGKRCALIGTARAQASSAAIGSSRQRRMSPTGLRATSPGTRCSRSRSRATRPMRWH